MQNNELNKTIVVIGLTFAFVLNITFLVYSRTLQRTADDLVKINGTKLSKDQQAKLCQEQGGEPYYYEESYYSCKFAKK